MHSLYATNQAHNDGIVFSPEFLYKEVHLYVRLSNYDSNYLPGMVLPFDHRDVVMFWRTKIGCRIWL